MIKAGLTGGIGSGKTTVSEILALLGVPVYNSDERGRWLSDFDPEVRRLIADLFGPEAYGRGTLDRPMIASRVFGDKSLLGELNAIVHPAVRADFLRWADVHADRPYIVFESAILFESGFDRDMDRIVTVTAPEALRIRRAALRDGTDPEAVRRRIANQMTDDERIARSHYVLRADDRELLIPQVQRMHERLSSE